MPNHVVLAMRVRVHLYICVSDVRCVCYTLQLESIGSIAGARPRPIESFTLHDWSANHLFAHWGILSINDKFSWCISRISCKPFLVFSVQSVALKIVLDLFVFCRIDVSHRCLDNAAEVHTGWDEHSSLLCCARPGHWLAVEPCLGSVTFLGAVGFAVPPVLLQP